MEHLNALNIFSKTAQLQSFSKAAQALGLSKSTVSKTVSDLEQAHGVRLLNRNSRQVNLTAEGESLLQHCLAIEQEYYQAMAQLEQGTRQASGRLRVSVPLLVGKDLMAPRLPEFLQQHPELSVHLDVRHTSISLLEDQSDLAIVFGDLPDSNMVATRLASFSVMFFASTRYLARHGTPKTPSDLLHHHNLLMTLPNLNHPDRWRFRDRSGQEIWVAVPSRLSMNDSLSLKEALLNDGGVMGMPPQVLKEELRAGKVKRVLAEYQVDEVPIYAVYHSRKQQPYKVQAMIEFIRELVRDYLK